MKARILAAAILLGPALGAAQEIEPPPPGMARRLPSGYLTPFRLNRTPFAGGWAHRTALARQANVPVSGSLPVAVVQALFSDSPVPAFTHTQIQQQIFSGPSTFGTVTDFYEEDSGGRFTIAGQAFPWVRTSLTRDSVVGDNFGLGGTAMTGAYLLEALALTDSTTDFSQFDNDGPDNVPNSGDDDGMVDAVAFHFLEVSASCGGNGIWPHRWSISAATGAAYLTNDLGKSGLPVIVDSYIIQSAVVCSGDEIARASTIAHELGHVLGLPDYYDSTEGILPDQRRWVMGCWSLMAAGAWGCGQVDRNSVDRPTHMGPWEKDVLGWVKDVQLVGAVRDSTFALDPVMIPLDEHVLKVPLNGVDEFLYIEYRLQDGFDTGLPAAGVLVYHIEPARTRQPCSTCEKIYQVALVEADGDSALVKLGPLGGNRGEPGDAFQTGDRLSSGTVPSIRLNSGEPSSVTIHSILVTAAKANLTISTSIIPLGQLTEALLSSATPLAAADVAFLDKYGNQNGSFDVGDLRAYRRDNPGR